MMPDTQPAWTIGRLLQWTADYFQKQGVDTPRLDAEVLLAAARDCERIDLYAAFHEVANDTLRATFRELVRRRSAGEPVAYLVGHREFYSMSLLVTPDVLIPRPETESLVVAALDRAKEVRPVLPTPRPLDIADVGTGSGAIAIAVARHADPCRVTAIDVSNAALTVARNNAERQGVAERIEWFESDLFATVSPERSFDLIVSNPPYVTESEYDNLSNGVRGYEPRAALVAGIRGTEVIEPLIDVSGERLHSGGWLLIEISPMISEATQQMIATDPRWEAVTCHRDLAGMDRVIEARRRVDSELLT